MKFFWFFCFSFAIFAEQIPTICLNMIVKNEKPVIERCLESVKPYIDYWVIVDTGSSDGTQDAIRNCLKTIPGELHERPWVDFAHNRNEALELARGAADYCLIIDADEIFVPSPSFNLSKLNCDLYSIPIHLTKEDGSVGVSPRAFLLSNRFPLSWVGIIHETIQAQKAPTIEMVQHAIIKGDMVSGHRSQDPQKYLKDAATLKQALAQDPTSSRNQFLLGASYELAHKDELALEAFEVCSRMKQCEKDELYRSLFQIGVIQQRLGRPASQFLASFEKAYHSDPNRAEPLFFMAAYHIEKGHFKKAYEFLKKAVELSLPKESAYVERSIYTWCALYNLSICTEKLGKKEETREILKKLLTCEELPNHYRTLIHEKLTR